MKKIIFLILLVSLQSCDGQEKKSEKTKTVTEDKKYQIKNIDSVIDFLDKKYQTQGFVIPDTPNPSPSYSYLDKKIGGFTVNYIGKTKQLQYFWNVSNANGYFSKFQNPEDAASKSNDIRKHINTKDYYIVASYLPSKYISYLGGVDGEFDLKSNAETTFYLYEDSKWKEIGKIETTKIPENILAYETNLIQKYKFNLYQKSTSVYNGTHKVTVETSIPTAEIARSKYNFKINQNNINLSLVTYLEPPLCDGNYFGIERNDILELYYTGNELSCISISPKFFIKKENNHFYIKIVNSRENINEWLLME